MALTSRRWAGRALGAGAAAAAALIALAAPASAHTPDVEANCVDGTTTLTVELVKYNPRQPNTVKVTDGDAVLVEEEFGEEFTQRWELPGDVDHNFVVEVSAWDDPNGEKGWSFVSELGVGACVTPPTTTSPDIPTTTEHPGATEPPATTMPPAPQPKPDAEPEDELAATGASIALPLGIGAVLLAGGGVLLYLVRKRSRA